MVHNMFVWEGYLPRPNHPIFLHLRIFSLYATRFESLIHHDVRPYANPRAPGTNPIVPTSQLPPSRSANVQIVAQSHHHVAHAPDSALPPRIGIRTPVVTHLVHAQPPPHDRLSLLLLDQRLTPRRARARLGRRLGRRRRTHQRRTQRQALHLLALQSATSRFQAARRELAAHAPERSACAHCRVA